MARGVGIIGAGPGVAALHLPTLARVGDAFRVVHIADGGSGRSAALAARVGARSSTGIDAIMADPDVEVVSISVTLALAPNTRYHELVTDLPASPAAGRGAPDLTRAEVAAGVVRQLL